MKRGFLLMLGVVLALSAIMGVLQSLITLVAIIGASTMPGLGWYLYMIGAVVFGIAAAIALRASGHAPPARHWGLSLTGGLLGVLAGAILKAGLSVLIVAI